MSARNPMRRLRAYALAIATLALALPAHAIDYVWSNAAGGDWSVATNWTPNGVPNATADTATITLAGTYTVTVAAAVTVRALTIGGASGTQTLTITGFVNLNAGGPVATMTVNANGAINQTTGNLQGGPAQVTMNGRYDMSGGSITSNIAPFTIGPGATFALAGGAAKSIHSSTLVINNGTITSGGAGSLQVENNSTLTNAASGVIELQSDAGLLQGGAGTSVLNNAGTLRKTAGAGTSTLSLVQIVNTGTIEAQAGALQVGTGQSTVTASGAGNTFSAQGGAALSIGAVSGSFTGTTFAGAGTKSFAGGGTAQYTFGGAISATNTTFADSTLLGTFTLAGTLGWTSGILQGSPTIGPGAMLAVSGNLAKTLANGGNTLTNQGTITIAGIGELRIENSATLVNAATGTIDLQSDTSIRQTGGGQSTLTNANVLRKSAGSGTSTISLINFTNTGTVEAQTGTLAVANPGMNLQASGSNAFNALTGATLAIGQVSQASFNGTTFGGAGAKTIGFNNAPYTFAGTIGATNTTFTSGDMLGTFTLNGALTWTGGRMLGGVSPFNLTIPAGATLIVAGAGTKTLSASAPAQIVNSGTLLLNGTAGITMTGSNPQVVNNPSGLIDIASDAGITLTGCCTAAIANAGTLRKSAGAGASPITDVSLANTGTLLLQSGTLNVSGAANTFTQTAGRLELAGGGLFTARPLAISGGVLTGSGAIQGFGPVSVTGTSQTRPGSSPGRISVANPLTQTGALVVELNGPAPITQYDQVAAGAASVAVGGALNVSLGYVPPVGTVFTILDKTSAGPVSGAFTGLPEGTVFVVNGVQLAISYVGGTGNDVTLTVFQNTGLICTPFTDVDQADPLCPAVQWIKNRGVTIGCTATLYCPFQPTTRAQMALFMNRLGNVLTDAPTLVEAANAAGNPDANEVVCQSANLVAAVYERHVTLDAVLMGLGNGSNQIGVEPVASVDGGANWISLAPPVPFATVNGRWSNVRVNGNRDVAPNETVRYGLRLSRLSGTTSFAEARCVMRLMTGNRTANAGADENE